MKPQNKQNKKMEKSIPKHTINDNMHAMAFTCFNIRPVAWELYSKVAKYYYNILIYDFENVIFYHNFW